MPLTQKNALVRARPRSSASKQKKNANSYLAQKNALVRARPRPKNWGSPCRGGSDYLL